MTNLTTCPACGIGYPAASDKAADEHYAVCAPIYRIRTSDGHYLYRQRLGRAAVDDLRAQGYLVTRTTTSWAGAR